MTLRKRFGYLLVGGVFQHLWQASLAVFFGLCIVAFLPVVFVEQKPIWTLLGYSFGAGTFFHVFHFAHIFFAAATSFLAFVNLSGSLWVAVCFGATLPVFVCTLSDVFLPYIGGTLLSVSMDLHLCLLCNLQAMIYLIISGLLLGFFILKIQSKFFLDFHLIVHFCHSFVSAIASLVYTVGFGFFDWKASLLPVFFLLLLAVILPCVLSDLLIPKIVVQLFGLQMKTGCCQKRGC